MAPQRRGGGRTSTRAILLWAASALLCGLGMGFFLSQQGCDRAPSKPRERKEEPAPRPAPRKTPREPEPRPQPSGPPAKPEPEPAREKPRMALVIDDLGYTAPELVTRLCAQPAPFSVAVLPFLEYSKQSAEIAHGAGKEVLLHLPMEPIGYPGAHKDPGPGAIFYGLSEKDVRSRVRKALDEIPHRKGVNNHMGSRITPDRQRMLWILQEVRAFRCFFLDSRTEKDSVASEVAAELKIPTVQRNVFLDDDKDFAQMEKQWERAIGIAQKEGRVVVIGHVYPETVEALEKLIPRLRGRVSLVRAGELAQ